MVNESADDRPNDSTEAAISPPRGGESEAGLERAFAELLAKVLTRAEPVPVDGHFFADLGADSLVMAHFCARVRKRADLPSVSMKDIYAHPTVRGLATALADAVPAAAGAPADRASSVSTEAPLPGSTVRYVLCGIAQLLFFFGYSYLIAFTFTGGYGWVADGTGPGDIYVRAVLFGGAEFFGLCAFPIVVKWVLVGRWTPREFPVWGVGYLRFWIVKVLVQANPVVVFVGSPIYLFYLRALGAKVGKHVTVLSRHVPVCTDLLSVGAGSVLRKDSFFLCYRAYAGRIQTGRVTLGRNVFVGERTVLDINSSIGDGGQLGHTSTLQSGDAVPAGQRWHGSPGQPTELDYLRVAPARCGTARRAAFGLADLARTLLVVLPLSVLVFAVLWSRVPVLAGTGFLAEQPLTSAAFYVNALLLSAVLFVGFVVVGLVVLVSLPRVMHRVIEPGAVYPLYGFRYTVHRSVARMTNLKFFIWLFGDSSYIVHYLRSLGYDLSLVEQTGSNFGSGLQHESPFLSFVGSGTMVADGLSIMNAEFSGTSFSVVPTTIGKHNFLGNHIAYPPGGRTGDNCLLATKVMVPLDGEIREGVGLLGSPPFEIPRTVERDSRFDHLRSGDELRNRLAAKNRYNLRTMGLALLARWVHFFGLVLLGLATVNGEGWFGSLLDAGFLVGAVVLTALYYGVMERFLMRFRALEPQVCSIYDPYFWHHERLWKVPDTHLNAFNGTPFKAVLWRLLGVRIGRRVFDDGCYFTERTLTAVGDDCTLNASSRIQCHSQEDGTFKSDRSTLGAGCTLGVGALVHYGVTMGDGAVLAADSFLMKGEDVPPRALWLGNPAADAGSHRRQPPATDTGAESTPLADRQTPPRRSAHQGTTVARRTSG
ncbi:Pls/PosA family non-ribosomal peptide synthetase [Streptomyces sp. WZ-12]|uniref:Pls/PosA family non-ribosomal peptide synthetase n=1 Tax=Streptomyces sp. WZ-12 TaxID=3030210 RepID=UPI0023811478|nr:Pls/PosA family non-ribosomal peptide synthetase [Streptomyces sp. WZ-12]